MTFVFGRGGRPFVSALSRPSVVLPGCPAAACFPAAPGLPPHVVVDEALVAASAGRVCLVTEPGERRIVQPDGDTRLTRRRFHDWATFRLRKVVFLFHRFPSYWRHSRGVA